MFNFLAQTTYYYNSTNTSDVDSGVGAAVLILFFLLGLIVLVAMVFLYVGLWKLLQKAGRHGWSALVPYHNVVQVLEISGKPGWWVLLFFGLGLLLSIPFLNIILAIPVLITLIVFNFIIHIALAKSFGKSDGFGVMMTFFPFIGYPMLGMSDKVKYVGPPKA